MGRELLPTLFLLLLASTAEGQGWTLEASAGRAVYDPLIERIAAVNGSLGLRYEGVRGDGAYLSTGADVEGLGPAWVVGGGETWLGGRGSVAWGARVGAHLHGFGETREYLGGAGATLELLPALRLRRGRVEAEIHSGTLQNVSRSGGITIYRSAFEAGGRVAATPLPWITLGGEARYLHVSEGPRPYVAGRLQLSRGRATAWSELGQWLGRDAELLAPRTGVGVGGSLRLPAGMAVAAEFNQSPGDPLFESPPRRSWSIRVGRALGASRGVMTAPPPPALPLVTPADGGVVFRLPLADHSAAPAVLGDFTEWQPVAMARGATGWELRLPLSPGVYRYGFRNANGGWFVPDGLPQGEDGMGGSSAILLIPVPESM